MQLALYSTYVVSVLLLIATPGPVLANTIDTSIRRGTLSGFFSIAGSNLASLILIACAVLILTGTVTLNESFLYWMSLSGCVFIAYISIKSLFELLTTSTTNPQTTHTQFTKKVTHFHSLRKGFFIAIANPKDILFFISFFPQFIHVTDSFYQSAGLLTITWITLDIGVLSLYVLGMKKALAKQYQKQISLLSNLLLLIVALGGLYLNLRS